jgi:hypothetical protein
MEHGMKAFRAARELLLERTGIRTARVERLLVLPS